MNYLQKIFHWDRNQSTFEKWLTVILALGIVVIGFVYFGVIGSFGVGASYNDIAQHAREAGVWWKIPGTLVLLFSIWWDYILFSDHYKFKLNEDLRGPSILLLWILVICINCGFRF
jgi:hypothetical protein